MVNHAVDGVSVNWGASEEEISAFLQGLAIQDARKRAGYTPDKVSKGEISFSSLVIHQDFTYYALTVEHYKLFKAHLKQLYQVASVGDEQVLFIDATESIPIMVYPFNMQIWHNPMTSTFVPEVYKVYDFPFLDRKLVWAAVDEQSALMGHTPKDNDYVVGFDSNEDLLPGNALPRFGQHYNVPSILSPERTAVEIINHYLKSLHKLTRIIGVYSLFSLTEKLQRNVKDFSVSLHENFDFSIIELYNQIA